MRIVLTNFGTTGEIYPILALAQELKRGGHSVTVGISPAYQQWVAQLGLDFAAIGPSLRSSENQLTLAATKDPAIFLKYDALVKLLLPLKEALPEAYLDLSRACSGAHLLISGHLQPLARMHHDKTGIPWISVVATYLSQAPNPPAFRRATEWLVNSCRRELALEPLRDPLAAGSLSDLLVLCAIDASLMNEPLEWPSHFRTPGHFCLDEAYWQPSEELLRFLANGPAPVIASFGSVVHEDPSAFARLLITAARQAGHRLILQRGWSGLESAESVTDVFVTDYVPHQWLFSRAACIIHHGGAGTTAAAFRAGAPSIIVPHLLDQLWWASCAERLGTAGPPMRLDMLTSQNLAERIELLTTDGNYRRAAESVATRINAKDGVRTARRLIEEAVTTL